jgi:K+-transporting ATPase KdpF subunit
VYTSTSEINCIGENCDGINLFDHRVAVLRTFFRDGLVVGTALGEKDMETLIYSIGGGVSALLFVYLVLALIKPEWFA